MTTNLWKMTREQHKEVEIRLNFGYYNEVFTAHELLSDGSFTIEELQACCELDGKKYTPRPSDDTDVVTMQVVANKPIEGEDPEEYTQDSYWELRSEAFARGGMQAVNDLSCSSETEDDWR